MRIVGTFPLDEHHFAPSSNAGAKTNKGSICKYHKKYTQSLTEDRDINPNDIYIYSFTKNKI